MCPYSFQMGGVVTNRKFEYNNDLKNQPVGWPQVIAGRGRGPGASPG